jgi:hypothetical protein
MAAEVIHAPPSAGSATRLVRGVPGSLAEAGLHTMFRAVLVSTGCYLAGFRDRKLLRCSVAGAIAIEVFLVGWAAYKEAELTQRKP